MRILDGGRSFVSRKEHRVLGDHGRVAEHPVPRLLVGLRGEELTGSVEIREGGSRPSVLYVRRGSPVHVVRPDTLDRLDLVLAQSGLLTSADIARAQLVRESTGQLMGQVLQQLGLVPQPLLADALRLQLRRKVARLFETREGTFDITRGDHPFGRDAASPGASVEARSLVFPGIFAGYDQGRLAAGLSELAGRRVRLARVGAAELTALGFNANHAPLLLHLHRSGFCLQEEWIHRRDGGRAREAKAVLLALLYLDLLEIAEEAAPSEPLVTSPRRAPTPVPDVDPAYLFALAQRLFRSGDLARAERTFESVARVETGNRRVQAFLIWIRFWKNQGPDREAAVELTLKALREVVRVEPAFAMGHYFIGELFKLRNEMNRAENAFRAAVSHDPDLVDAQRELRLITMRRRRG
jgi:tetratricopeptide (TPR) repeat protein